MESKKAKQKNDLSTEIQTLFTELISAYFKSGYTIANSFIKKDNFFLKRHKRIYRFTYFLMSIGFFISIYYVTKTTGTLKYFYGLCFFIYPTVSGLLSVLLAEEIFTNDLNYKIVKSAVKVNRSNDQILESILEDRQKTPLGTSFLDQKPIFLDTKRRVQHTMISGGSGQGKSSLAITMRRHDLKWMRPIIDIDPKGSKEDIEVIKEWCRIYGRIQDFKHFNIAEGEQSFCYNPLALGSVDERIEKMITVLELENEFYRGFASNIFSIIFQCMDALKETPTMKKLCELLIDKNSLQGFFKDVLLLPDGTFNDLKKQINAFRDFDKEKILGIQAKINRLNSPLFRKILNPSDDNEQNLDLVNIVKNNQYAYFQLNIAQYKEVSTYLINFILYDLKLICGAIDGGKLELKSDLLPVYIDEFASFGNEDFPEFLRVARSGRVGITLMFQSFASLDVITPVLKDEISTNTIYSVHFYPGSTADIDYISTMPGTIYTNQRSFQVLGNGTNPTDDSRGTQFRSEEMKLDPNLYRELKIGQATVYLKDQNKMDVMGIWHGKAALSDFLARYKMKNAEDKADLSSPKKEAKGTINILESKTIGKINSKNLNQKGTLPIAKRHQSKSII